MYALYVLYVHYPSAFGDTVSFKETRENSMYQKLGPKLARKRTKSSRHFDTGHYSSQKQFMELLYSYTVSYYMILI